MYEPGGINKVENPETPSIMSDFEMVLSELAAMHEKKQKDYGTGTDPYANIRGSSDWGPGNSSGEEIRIEPWVGSMIRANDKMKRLQKYSRDGKLANESAEDSFIDLAVYAIIGLMLWREVGAVDRRLGKAMSEALPELKAALKEIKGGDCSEPQWADVVVEIGGEEWQ